MREALELWEKYQPESAAEYFEIVHQKGLQEGVKKGVKKGRQEGVKKGRQEGMEEVAERLIGKGMLDADIHVITQLSMEEIARLRNGSSE